MSIKPKLSSFDIKGVAQYILNGHAKHIICMTGAGISCASGIPDFRSIGTGLYSNLERYHLKDPADIFTLSYFEKDPAPFFDLLCSLLPGKYKPTAVHYFIKLLERKNLLQRLFTQNIDGLERIAGIDPEKIVECHGSFFTSHCRTCNHEYSLEEMRERFMSREIVHCTQPGCDGIVKPDIVFFGEGIPSKFRLARPDFQKCDLLIIIGTSLKVNPFASLASYPEEDVPRVLINNVKVAQYTEEIQEIDGTQCIIVPPNHRSLLRYDHKSNTRDVYIGGDCQQAILDLVQALGWKDEFDQIIAESSAG